MATKDLVWAETTATIDEVALEMADRWVRHVLVEDGGRLVGIVSARDLLGAYAAVADTLHGEVLPRDTAGGTTYRRRRRGRSGTRRG